MERKTTGCSKQLVPAYAIIPLISCVIVNCLVYFGLASLASDWKHYDFTTSFDRMVPVVPWFVSIYLVCYLFWIVNYIMIARISKEHCMRFVTADMISRLICGVFYLLIPTTNVRPVLEGSGMWTELLRMIYQIDQATNLFPSIHCLVSWFCFIGIRGQKSIPRAYRIFSCVFAILVFVSTQVTKQHYIIDVVGGMVIAEAAYYLTHHTQFYRSVEKWMDRITGLLFGKKAPDSGKESLR